MEGSETVPKGSWNDPVEEGGGGLAAEDRGSRLGKEITGGTDPVAKRGKVPPGPIDGSCGMTGNVGKTGGIISPGAPVK